MHILNFAAIGIIPNPCGNVKRRAGKSARKLKYAADAPPGVTRGQGSAGAGGAYSASLPLPSASVSSTT